MLLPVPYHPQEHVTSCIPAAVRMALSFWSVEQNELALSQILQSEEEGTSIFNIEFLQEAGIGVTVWVGEMDVEELKQNLDQGVPVINESRPTYQEALDENYHAKIYDVSHCVHWLLRYNGCSRHCAGRTYRGYLAL